MLRCRRLTLIIFIIFMTFLILFISHLQSSNIRDKINKWEREILQTDSAVIGMEQPHKPNNSRDAHQPPVNKNSLNDVGPVPVILLTYMRSGSTFVGDLLQSNANVFYMFEPLHKLQFTIRDNKPIRYVNGTQRFYDSFLNPASTMIENMATCNVQGVPIPVFEDGFFPYAKKARGFRTCVGTRMITDLSKARNCLHYLKHECTSSSHLVFKIIRIPMYILEPLMEKIPKLKIVHLLRDPRATMSSQNKAGVVKKLYLAENATKYCNRVYDDVIKAEDFKRKFPGRLMTVLYEDITANPVEFTKKLYSFTNMQFTNEVRSKVMFLTSAKNINNVHKGNSSTRAFAWRKSLDMNFVTTIDNSCTQIYAKLGIRRIPSEPLLRDMSYSLHPITPKFDDYRYA